VGSWGFFIDLVLTATLWPLGRLSLTEMITTDISWGKGGRCVGLNLPASCTDYLQIWLPQTPGAPRACPGL